ncbi:MAG: helix-turn-helix transcriptional regulator [Propionibacteriaceae bacterium]
MASPGKAGERSAARIARICQTPANSRNLRLKLLEEIRGAVPFDAYAWLLTDPATSVGSSPLAAVPCLPELPDLIRLKYLTDVNRWTRLESPVALLSQATDGLLFRSRVWRELQARYNVTDVASVVFSDPFGCWAFLDLWRAGAHGQFTAAELNYLTGIVGPVTTALRRCQASAFNTGTIATGQPRGPVVLLLSGTLDVLAQTPETQAYLRVLVPPDENQTPIPASAYNVAAQLLAVEARIDVNPPTARVHLFGGRWLTLRAARIADPQRSHRADIAVSIEDSSPTERTELFGRVHALSSRERELLDHLVTGRDTRDLARLMFLSPHTIQDHLKSIFDKTSVRNRRTLLSRALGT